SACGPRRSVHRGAFPRVALPAGGTPLAGRRGRRASRRTRVASRDHRDSRESRGEMIRLRACLPARERRLKQGHTPTHAGSKKSGGLLLNTNERRAACVVTLTAQPHDAALECHPSIASFEFLFK